MNNAASLFPSLATSSAPACPSPSSLGNGLACQAQPGAEAPDSFGSMLADALPSQQPPSDRTAPASDGVATGADLACRPSSAANPRALARELSTGEGLVRSDSAREATPNWGRSIEVLTAKITEKQNPGWAPQGLVRRLPELFSPVVTPVTESSLEALCALPLAPSDASAAGFPSDLIAGINAAGGAETACSPTTGIAADRLGEIPGSDDPVASSGSLAPLVMAPDLSSGEGLDASAPTISQALRPGACPARPLSAHAAAGLAKAVVHLGANASASLGRTHPAGKSQDAGTTPPSSCAAGEGIEEVDTDAGTLSSLSSGDSSAQPVVSPLEGSGVPLAAANTLPPPASSLTARGSTSGEGEDAGTSPSSGSAPSAALSDAAPVISGQAQLRGTQRAHESGKRPSVPSLTPHKPEYAMSGSFLASLERPAPSQAEGMLPLSHGNVAASADQSAQEAGVSTFPESPGSRRDLGHAELRHSMPAVVAAAQDSSLPSVPMPQGGTLASGENHGRQPLESSSNDAADLSHLPECPSLPLSPEPARQGGGAERSALTPSSQERQGIPFGREQNTGNAIAAQSAEPSAAQAQSLTHAAARSAVMRSYGVPAKAPFRDASAEQVDSVSSSQVQAADTSAASAASSASPLSSSSGSSSRGGAEERSSLTDGRSRQDGEKYAVQGLQQRPTDFPGRVSSKEKTVQAAGGKIEAKVEKLAGIDDAKKAANMNPLPSLQAPTDVLPASRSAMDWVSEGLSRLGSGDTSSSSLAQSELAPHAKQLVERVEKALESLQSRPERVVRFDVGDSRDERLSVSLQLKDGVIHTTFASGSSELRDLISREWSGSLGSALSPEAHLRVAEPVFTASPRNENLDTGSQSQRQQQQQPGQQGHAAGQQGQGLQRGSTRAASVAAPEAAVQVLPSASSSHRVLQAFA